MFQWRSVTGAITVEFVFSGSERLYQDIELMTGTRPSVLWKVCWWAISPFCLLVSVTMKINCSILSIYPYLAQTKNKPKIY